MEIRSTHGSGFLEEGQLDGTGWDSHFPDGSQFQDDCEKYFSQFPTSER